MKVVSRLSWTCALWACLSHPNNVSSQDADATPEAGDQTCTWEDGDTCTAAVYKDKNLKPMKILFDDLEETFDAYVTPDVATFYNATPGSVEKLETSFRGVFAKFINMGSRPVHLYVQAPNPQHPPMFISEVGPFRADGTVTFPGTTFFFADKKDVDNVLYAWNIVGGKSNYKYDPFGKVLEASKELTPGQLESYKLQHRNLAFDRLYKRFTGRDWIALYGRRNAPRYKMWPADSFGQTHTLTTRATKFVSTPPNDLANARLTSYAPTPEDLELMEKLKPYREPGETLTLNMTVLSVAPRAFEIQNFLSAEEVRHLLEVASGMKLGRSTTSATEGGEANTNDESRTSDNSWISRERSAIVDNIFRRTADLLQIDEACFRFREEDEKHLVPDSEGPISERLQLLHYGVGQQYTPHHDFGIPDLSHGQPSRFATVLLYLNEVEEGGETSFPRWLNGESTEVLKVKPEVGKAVLFYSILPDGNFDERSTHAAMPVTKGEKWLTNLWVWDPYMF